MNLYQCPEVAVSMYFTPYVEILRIRLPRDAHVNPHLPHAELLPIIP